MNLENFVVDLTKTRLEYPDGVNIGDIYYSQKSNRAKIVIFRIDDKCYCLYYHLEKDTVTSCCPLTVHNILRTHTYVGKIVLPTIRGSIDMETVEKVKKGK